MLAGVEREGEKEEGGGRGRERGKRGKERGEERGGEREVEADDYRNEVVMAGAALTMLTLACRSLLFSS